MQQRCFQLNELSIDEKQIYYDKHKKIQYSTHTHIYIYIMIMIVQSKHDTNNCFVSPHQTNDIVSLPPFNIGCTLNDTINHGKSTTFTSWEGYGNQTPLHQRRHFTDRSFIVVAAPRPPVEVDRTTGAPGRLRATHSPCTGYGTCGTKKAFWLHGLKGSKDWNLLD